MSKYHHCVHPYSASMRPSPKATPVPDSETNKQKPKPKATRWKPFHAWLNGKPKAPIVLGLTENDARFIAEAIDYIETVAIASGAKLHSSLTSQNKKCVRMLERRNLKPLRDTECGAIRSKDDR